MGEMAYRYSKSNALYFLSRQDNSSLKTFCKQKEAMADGIPHFVL